MTPRTGRPTRRDGLALLVVTALALAGCSKAGTGAGGTTPTNGIAHPMGAKDLVVRVEVSGGFVRPTPASQIPSFSLFGDGTVVTVGPQPAIFPGPALPSLIGTPLTETGVQAILRQAQADGLLRPSAGYITPIHPEALVTTFTVNAAGGTHVFRVVDLTAVAGTDAPPNIPPQELEARRGMAAFQAKLSDLRSWLPAGSIGPDTRYEPPAVQVTVTPGAPADQGLTEPSVDWPLAQPLATFGDQAPGPAGQRCGTVSGSDTTTLLAATQHATEISPWRSDAQLFTLAFVPLLPDRSGCSGPAA